MRILIPNDQVTNAFRQQAEPPHLGLDWKTPAQFLYTATANKLPYKWRIEDTSGLGYTRRVLDYSTFDSMMQLKSNGSTEYVIQQSAYPNFYMEQRDKLLDPNGTEHSGYENASLLLYQSNSQVTNSSGVKWTCTYTASSDSYEFINVMDPTVKLGYKNSWYVQLPELVTLT